MEITVPDDVLGGIELSPDDARIDVAIGLYKREAVSIGRAAEIAGVTVPSFQAELGKRRIPVNYDEGDLDADLEALRVVDRCPSG